MIQLPKWGLLGALAVMLLIGWLLGHQNKPKNKVEMGWVQCAPGEDGFSCSMHPKVRLKEKGDCPICGMPLVFETTREVIDLGTIQMTSGHFQTVKVSDQGSSGRSLELSGKVILDDSKVTTQIATLPGRIEELYVKKVGDLVRKGEPVARIFSKELISAVDAFVRPNTPESVKQSALNNLRDWNLPLHLIDELRQGDDYHVGVDIPAVGSGIVIAHHAHVGDQATNTLMGHPTTLFTMADLSTVWIRLDAYERDLEGLKKGLKVVLKLDALPQLAPIGHIFEIGPVMDESTRTMPVWIEVANPQLKLRPGMLARATIQLNRPTTPTQLHIPRSAILWTGKTSVVYVRDDTYDTPTFHYREVKLGRMDAETCEVLSGLQAGEEVVTEGAFTIDAAAQLQGKYSMMNPPRDGDLLVKTTASRD